jgi:hypothetical protein
MTDATTQAATEPTTSPTTKPRGRLHRVVVGLAVLLIAFFAIYRFVIAPMVREQRDQRLREVLNAAGISETALGNATAEITSQMAAATALMGQELTRSSQELGAIVLRFYAQNGRWPANYKELQDASIAEAQALSAYVNVTLQPRADGSLGVEYVKTIVGPNVSADNPPKVQGTLTIPKPTVGTNNPR